MIFIQAFGIVNGSSSQYIAANDHYYAPFVRYALQGKVHVHYCMSSFGSTLLC